MEKALPVGMRSAGGGMKRAFSGMWAGKEGGARFDMLRDEEGKEWETFGGEMGLKGRAGMGVWDAFGGEGTGASRTSFLGGALGGFVALGSRDEEEGDLAGRAGTTDSMLASIQEWDEREDDRSESHEDERTTESGGAKSVGTQVSSSTGPTTTSNDSHRLLSTPSRPFSPPSSLYGSSFAPQPVLAPRLSQSSSSSLSHADKLSRSSTWWSRLAKPMPADTATATANERIRDPTPAPALAAIVESPDPFSDAAALTYGKPDEQGRFDTATMALRHGRDRKSVV